LVVLVNRGTAGPAELVAAALMDNKRADLVGEKTFGEGAEQKVFELPDGGALILSIAKYAAPDGKKFQDVAVTPGTLVASNMDDLTVASHPLAQKAGVVLKKQAAPDAKDDQFDKAVQMLKAKTA
ncbi:MAG: S41 family peptidase, partial [Bryocella sp.]